MTTHVLIISHDVVGARMSGPGIRYYHLARVLAREFDVVLAAPGAHSPGAFDGFSVLGYRHPQDSALEQAVRQAQVVLVPAVELANVPALLDSGAALVLDGYDPFLAETLFLDPLRVGHLQRVLAQAYLVGDFVICASERQRDWWLGLLEAHGRINRYNFAQDPSFRQLVDVVPFGMPTERPAARSPVFRETWPGIGAQDKIILWGGGLWVWLDPLTAIRAVAQIWRERQDVRLVFPGTRHPNPGVAQIPTLVGAAQELAVELGLWNKAVFFGDWVPYADWPGVLLESDLALSLHHDTLETRLAFRTRILDYIWSGLPMVVTRGDEMSDLVERHQLGSVVGYGDVQRTAAAISRWLDVPKETLAERFERVRQALTWEKAVEPLRAFCRQPHRAPDKVALGVQDQSPFSLAEIERLKGLVSGYERGRFMRFSKWLYQAKQKLLCRLKGGNQ